MRAGGPTRWSASLAGQYPRPGIGQAQARRPLRGAAGRVEAEQRVRPFRHPVHPGEARAVSYVRPGLPCRGPHEGRPGVGRAVGDGGQHSPLGQRQAVPRRRILPAEPVERLAQEPQLA